MAGTTGLEPATSAVTANRKRVTYRNQEARMARFSSLRHPWQRLLDPYRPCDLCLADLFPPATLRGASGRFGCDFWRREHEQTENLRAKLLPLFGRGLGSNKTSASLPHVLGPHRRRSGKRFFRRSSMIFVESFHASPGMRTISSFHTIANALKASC